MDYDVQRAEQELLAIQPDATRLRLNGNDCWHYRITVPASDFDVVVAPHPNGLAVLQARASYDERLAIALLAFIKSKVLVTDTLTVADGFACAGYLFDRATIVPPPCVRNFRERSAYLEACSFWVLPSHLCEFQDGLSRAEFESLTDNQGGAIQALEWNRSPTPQAKVQLLTDWPGGMLSKRRKPGAIKWQTLIFIAKQMPSGVTILIVNALGEHAHLTAGRNDYQCKIKSASGTERDRRFAKDALDSLLTSFLLCKD